MNDKPEPELAAQPDLAAAIRQARIENAERGDAITDLREIEMGRLALLESALKPVVGQAPPGVDMFDLALARGDHPRLFVDMIAFVDMAHDRRTYRFHQDTRNGRLLIAESQSADAIAAAVANYVARRLIERERALASEWPEAQAPQADDRAPQADFKAPQVHDGPRQGLGSAQAEAKGPRAWPMAGGSARAWPPPAPGAIDATAGDWATPPRRRFVRRLGDVLSVFLMMLGSITLALLIGLGAVRGPASGERGLRGQHPFSGLGVGFGFRGRGLQIRRESGEPRVG